MIPKGKTTPVELFLLGIRQMLLNQSQLLISSHGSGHTYTYANDSKQLAERIEKFIKNKE